jgi:RHS repeat-associated protein
VWDGEQELYEIQMPGEDGSLHLENDVAPLTIRSYTGSWPTGSTPQPFPSNFFEYDPNAAFGRVAYVHGAGVDQPLGLVRIGFQKYWEAAQDQAAQSTTFAPFAMSLLWDWRGQSDITRSMAGTNSHCEVFSGVSRCVTVRGQRNNWIAYKLGTFYVKGAGWHGTVITGKRDETGTMYRRARYYDPATGRFTQEDPIGLAGGLNQYAFGGGDPVNFADPGGNLPLPVITGGIGAVGGAVIGTGAYLLTTPRSQWTFGGGLTYAAGGLVAGGSLGAGLGFVAPGIATPIVVRLGLGRFLPVAGTVGAAQVVAGGAAVPALIPPAGKKLAQMIGRWGESGGKDAFMKHAQSMAEDAAKAGTFVTGQVGELAQATIYRMGHSYMVVDGFGVIRSYIHTVTRQDGIITVYRALGGQ